VSHSGISALSIPSSPSCHGPSPSQSQSVSGACVRREGHELFQRVSASIFVVRVRSSTVRLLIWQPGKAAVSLGGKRGATTAAVFPDCYKCCGASGGALVQTGQFRRLLNGFRFGRYRKWRLSARQFGLLGGFFRRMRFRSPNRILGNRKPARFRRWPNARCIR
jgi:hypothetical protein